jgi:aminoglycoside phosphotransferase (APT) family kinase protein
MAARDVGAFLSALHRPAPRDVPSNPWRGVPLAQRAPALAEGLARIGHRVDAAAVSRTWDRLLQASPWAGAPLWIHGDLHPDNLLFHHGRLSAVLDFGDLTAGDPATDLAVAWMLCPAAARPTLRAAARNADSAIDEDTWLRARAWAVALGVAYLAHSRGDARLEALGVATIDAVLSDAE